MRILCDLDGVVIDLLPAWLEKYNYYTGENVKLADITEYGFGKFVKNEKILFSALCGGLTADAQPMPGAIEGVNALVAQGHEVVFVTYVLDANIHGFAEKKAWLKKYGLDHVRISFCHSEEKQYIDGDILIEDYPRTISQWLERGGWGGHAFLIDHLYNRGVELTRTTRVESVADVAQFLGGRKAAA